MPAEPSPPAAFSHSLKMEKPLRLLMKLLKL